MAAPESSASESPARAPLVELVALVAWLGAALLFAGVVARAAFDVLPTRELAGALVGRILPVIFLAGMGVGGAVLIAELLGDRRRRSVPRLAGGLVIAVACAIAQFGIAPRIAELRAELPGPLAEMPADAPARVAFGRLHLLSVVWLGVAIAAAAVTSGLAGAAVRSARRS